MGACCVGETPVDVICPASDLSVVHEEHHLSIRVSCLLA